MVHIKPAEQWIEEYGNGGPDNDGYLCHDKSLPRYGEIIDLVDMYRMVQADALEAAAKECERLTKEWKPNALSGHFDLGPDARDYPDAIRKMKPT